MQQKIFTLFFIFIASNLCSQQLINFEGQLNELDTFKNGQAGENQFIIGPVLFPNEYDHQNDFWAGQWAMSSSRNDTTGNYLNLYGCIDGEGADGSDVYAIAQEPIYGNPLYISSSSPIMPDKVYITNTTYAYNVIKDGNQFSKAFGGPSGDDPDYFYIEWNGYLDGELQGSEQFYLADYRFSDNSQDYIIDQWTQMDLSDLGVVDRIEIHFHSTDTGEFGINTPLFFAIDNFEYGSSSSAENILEEEAGIYPNPTSGPVYWKQDVLIEVAKVVDLNGKVMMNVQNPGKLNIGHLPEGVYFLQWKTKTSEGIKKLIKK